jgi:LmbE family N-acetylglucosaminyl deacetylase
MILMRGTIAKVFTFAVSCVVVLGWISTSQAQLNLSGAAEIKLALDKLNVLGSVLMIAAHPDDENDYAVAYFGRGRKVETAYLSATRGEGGQNLIGSEQGDLLGLIRTQELISAVRVDGAQQFFTRAIDFGFSKTSAETLEKWGHDKLLSDMVWVIRVFEPDVIIQQWSGTTRDGHGQHQASGIVGREAYVAAADPTKFPEQLKWVKPWQTKRMVGRNPNGRGPYARTDTPPPAPAADRITIDPGQFDPVLGKSYEEIGAISRSQHQSQGQGSLQRWGAAPNDLVVLAGDKASKDFFDGIDITWNRVPGGAEIGRQLAAADAQYDIEHPEKTLPALLAVRPAIAKLAASGNIWGERKLRDLDEAAALCAGLGLDALASQAVQSPGGKWKINLIAIERLHTEAGAVRVTVEGLGQKVSEKIADSLPYNRTANKEIEFPIPADAPNSQPFWLVKPHGAAYEIDDQRLIGRPDPVPVLEAKFQVSIGGQEIAVVKPVRYRFVDTIEGEKFRPIVVAPRVAVNLAEQAIVFPNGGARQVAVALKAEAGKASGTLRIAAPEGWKVSPASTPFTFEAAGEERQFSFSITPPLHAKPANFKAIATVDGKDISSGVHVIAYSHIPPQTVFPPAEGKLVPAPLTVLSKRIGYVMGAGDEVPDSIRQMGCSVVMLTDADLAGTDLSGFDAIVTGVRAYDVREALRANQRRLLDYVSSGGTLVVQYNRSGERLEGLVGPYPMTFSAQRVTVEDAPVTFTNPQSLLLNAPNKITQSDFDGWIQERGIYFASKWDAKYETVLESHDPGEKPLTGGMLVTRYGKGVYVFTGYAWFRQLPAGVPGAYRIFANLLSAGKVTLARR